MRGLIVPAGWLRQFVCTRRGGQQLALEFLAELAGPDGRVRGYAKAAIGHASGVNERQARNQLAALAKPSRSGDVDRPAAIEIVPVFAPQQTANDYFVLVPWVCKARESMRLAMLIGEDSYPPPPTPATPESPARAATPGAISDPDPPPRQRTSTLNTSAMADYWRSVNKTRW